MSFLNVVSLMLFNVTPANFFTHESLRATGTSATSFLIIVCPSFLSHKKPSPVEPVSGRDVPPLAITHDRARIINLSARVITICFNDLSYTTPATRELARTFTPPFFIYKINTSHTDFALFETGNILPSASSFVFIPRSLKKFSVSFTPNWVKAEKRNLSLFLYFASIVRTSGLLFVTLHLPPPVIKSFLPSVGFFSSNKTLLPRSAARPAAIMPAGPPPITTTSHNICSGICRSEEHTSELQSQFHL